MSVENREKEFRCPFVVEDLPGGLVLENYVHCVECALTFFALTLTPCSRGRFHQVEGM